MEVLNKNIEQLIKITAFIADNLNVEIMKIIFLEQLKQKKDHVQNINFPTYSELKINM